MRNIRRAFFFMCTFNEILRGRIKKKKKNRTDFVRGGGVFVIPVIGLCVELLFSSSQYAECARQWRRFRSAARVDFLLFWRARRYCCVGRFSRTAAVKFRFSRGKTGTECD